MNLNHPKMRPLLKRQIIVSSESTALFKKGEHHSKVKDSLVLGKCTNEFARRVCKTVQSRRIRKIISKFGEPYIASLTHFLRNINLRHLVCLRPSISFETLCQFTKRTRHPTLLENLSIYLDPGTAHSPEGLFVSLKKTLKRLCNLKRYKISLMYDQMDNNQLTLFLNTFYVLNANKVEDVQLEFRAWGQNIKDGILNNFLAGLALNFTNCPRLKRLCWDLEWISFWDRKEIIAEPWKNVFQIKSLQHIHLHGVKLDETLFDGLALLPDLTSLNLKVPNLSKEQILSLAEGLNRLQPLQQIKLCFHRIGDPSKIKIDDKVFSKLCDSLMRHSICLEVLNLSIFQDVHLETPVLLSSKGFSSITALLKSCTQLKHLSLLCAVELDQPTLMDLMASISNLSHLKGLLFYFIGKKDITNDVFLALSKILFSLNLEELYLFFTSFSQVTDNGVLELANSLSQMRKLQIFNMDFQHFPELTKKASQDISAALKKIKCLQQGRLRIAQGKPKAHFFPYYQSQEGDAFAIEDVIGNFTRHLDPQYKYHFPIILDQMPRAFS